MSEEANVIEQTRYEETYFYVEDVSGVSTYFSITRDKNAPEITVYCSTNALEWEIWGHIGGNNSTCITKIVPANGRLYLKAVTNSWGNEFAHNRITHDYLTKPYEYNVGGNIMSLLYGDDFHSKTSFPDDSSEYTLAYLFSGSSVRSAENLVLPATTLHKADYAGMFKDCAKLVDTPSLPATNLSYASYYAMFKGCVSLTTAPDLPATVLQGMCYESLFENCSSLEFIKADFLTIPGRRYTKNWVEGVSENGTFVKNVEATWNLIGSNGIPYWWTVVCDEEEEEDTQVVLATTVDETDFNVRENVSNEEPDCTFVDEVLIRYQNNDENTYFYLEDVSGTETYFTINKDKDAPEITVYYSTDGLNWELWGCTGCCNNSCITLLVPANGRIYLKSDATSWGRNLNYNKFTHDYMKKSYEYNVGGNILSLIYGDDFFDKTTFPDEDSEHTLAYLFSGSSIRSAEHLVLPVEYLHKFDYAGMFKNCKKLVKAPALPATHLSQGCYFEMFKGCIRLTEAPELYARILVNECYEEMFEGCSSLAYIKAAFETTPSIRYTKEWVNGVARVGTFVKNEDANWFVLGVNGIPYGWTIVNEHMLDPEPGGEDYLDITTEVCVVEEENVPYCGASPGDEYIDITIRTGATGGVDAHIYVPLTVIGYHAGPGISIDELNYISLLCKNENGLYVDENGLGLNLSSGTSGGAMSVEQYNKLEGIEEGAEVNVQSDWNENDSSSDAFILNKPDGKMFGGVITPDSSSPASPNQNVYYVGFEPGTYTNFGEFVLPAGRMAIVYYSNGSWQTEIYNYDRVGYFEVHTEYDNPLSVSQIAELVKNPCFAKDQRENFYFKVNETRGYYNFFSIPNMWSEEGVINIANTGFRVSKADYTLGLLDETLFTYTTEGVQTVIETIVQEAQVGAALFQGTTDLPDDGTVTGEHWKFSTLEDYKKGQYWVVASAGTYVGQVCEPGDFVFCIADKDTSYSASNFSVIQNNIETITNNDIDTITSNLS